MCDKFSECVIGVFTVRERNPSTVFECLLSIYIAVSCWKFLQETGNMPDVKSDMERVGLFKEMGYISIGDKYKPFPNRRSKYYYTKSHVKNK